MLELVQVLSLGYIESAYKPVCEDCAMYTEVGFFDAKAKDNRKDQVAPVSR
jgi:hypothetical protein